MELHAEIRYSVDEFFPVHPRQPPVTTLGFDVNKENGVSDLGYWIQGLRASDARQRAHSATVLGLLGPQAQSAVPALVEALREQDLQIRRVFLAALSEIGPAARTSVPALVACLRDSNDLVRRRAAYCLGELGPVARTAVPALIESLKDKNGMIRRHVIQALGEIGEKASLAVTALLDCIRPSDLVTRILIREAILKIGSVTIPDLLPALKDPSAEVRRSVAIVLGRMGGDETMRIAALQSAFQDGELDVREAARIAMERLQKR